MNISSKNLIIAKLAELIGIVYEMPEDKEPEVVEESYTDYEPDYIPSEDLDTDKMPDITAAPNAPKTDSQPLPESTEIVKVDDLNGIFAPQTGNIQPTVVGVPEPVQVDVLHAADEVEGDIVEAKIDDWATVTASEIAKDVLSEPTQPTVQTEPTPVITEMGEHDSVDHQPETIQLPKEELAAKVEEYQAEAVESQEKANEPQVDPAEALAEEAKEVELPTEEVEVPEATLESSTDETSTTPAEVLEAIKEPEVKAEPKADGEVVAVPTDEIPFQPSIATVPEIVVEVDNSPTAPDAIEVTPEIISEVSGEPVIDVTLPEAPQPIIEVPTVQTVQPEVEVSPVAPQEDKEPSIDVASVQPVTNEVAEVKSVNEDVVESSPVETVTIPEDSETTVQETLGQDLPVVVETPEVVPAKKSRSKKLNDSDNAKALDDKAADEAI